MTVQEAIEILRDTPIDIRSTREDDIHTLYATAQGMPIEALSAQEKPYLWQKEMVKILSAQLDNNLTEVDNKNDELSCSEEPNGSEPKTAESGSVDSEQPEIKMDRTNDRLIWQQDAIEQIKLLYEGREDDIYDRLWNRALKGATNAIKHHTPTAQPEVIRCENCQKRDDKWEDWEEGKVYWCDIMDGCVKADDYCSYAERRTDE